MSKGLLRVVCPLLVLTLPLAAVDSVDRGGPKGERKIEEFVLGRAESCKSVSIPAQSKCARGLECNPKTGTCVPSLQKLAWWRDGLHPAFPSNGYQPKTFPSNGYKPTAYPSNGYKLYKPTDFASIGYKPTVSAYNGNKPKAFASSGQHSAFASNELDEKVES